MYDLSFCRCAVISTIPSGGTANFLCGAMEGRYVIVHIPGDEKTLNLCEVEVYKYSGGNSLSYHTIQYIMSCHSFLWLLRFF